MSMMMHEASKLHHTPIPPIMKGGLAQHDLRRRAEDLTQTLTACKPLLNQHIVA